MSRVARKRGRRRRHTLEHWPLLVVRFGKLIGRFRKQDLPATTQLVAIRRAVQVESLAALRQLIPWSKEEVCIRNLVPSPCRRGVIAGGRNPGHQCCPPDDSMMTANFLSFP